MEMQIKCTLNNYTIYRPDLPVVHMIAFLQHTCSSVANYNDTVVN